MELPREELPALLERLHWKEAIALIGPRRAGKSTLAGMLSQAWQAQGGRVACFDFESEGAPRTAGEVARAAESLPADCLLVLDEVQVVEDWTRFVRSQTDHSKRKVVIAGSSASLLSSEAATSLAGRAVPETVLPLSYRDARRWGLRSVGEYLATGGFPECALRPLDAPKLHRIYFQLAVLRDVAARLRVREQKALVDLARLVLSEPGKAIAVGKTAARLGISQPTFRSWISAFNDAFLILSIPPFFRSPRERILADAKHYAIDTGLQRDVSLSASADLGRQVENLVAIELTRRGYSLSFYSGKNSECDFIAQKIGKKNLAVQAYSGERDPPTREIEGLREGMKRTGSEGLFISMHPVNFHLAGARQGLLEEWLLEPLVDG